MVAQHEAIVRVLEEEKEYYKKEYETLKALKRSVTPSRLTPTKVSRSHFPFFLLLFLPSFSKYLIHF